MSSSVPNGATELEQWMTQFRDRLRAAVQLRLHPQLAGRFDPSDVIQEAYLEAAQRYEEYRRNPTLSPYLWLRFLTLQRLQIVHRRHLQAQMRAADRETALPELEVSSVGLAHWLVDSGPSPLQAALRREQQARLQQALETLPPQDREILTLRHFEQLNSDEAAQALGITPVAANRRYYRALDRLREIVLPILGDISS
jgi:RNA polymerase sigma-70 factor (ECF subfamily)